MGPQLVPKERHQVGQMPPRKGIGVAGSARKRHAPPTGCRFLGPITSVQARKTAGLRPDRPAKRERRGVQSWPMCLTPRLVDALWSPLSNCRRGQKARISAPDLPLVHPFGPGIYSQYARVSLAQGLSAPTPVPPPLPILQTVIPALARPRPGFFVSGPRGVSPPGTPRSRR